MKTYQFTIGKKDIRLEMECKREAARNIVDMDGYKFELDKMINEKSSIICYVDGEFIGKEDDLFLSEVWMSGNADKIPSKYVKYIYIGNTMIPFTQEQVDELELIIADVENEGTTPEAIEIIKAFEDKENLEKTENAYKIIEEANKQNTIPSYTEARAMERKYNDIANEGGSGYVPHVIDIDEYNYALNIVKQNN